jgi:hypothetical protein
LYEPEPKNVSANNKRAESKQRQIHLLLGNGFSMAYNPEIFSYNALHNFISSQDNLKIKSPFDIVKTKNFELVMQQLDNFIDIPVFLVVTKT